MAKTVHSCENSGSKSDVHTIQTSAEMFPDGSFIELVCSASGEELALLHYSRESATIAREVRLAGRTYRPIELHASFLRAIRLPTGIADPIEPGALFRELSELYQDYLGMPGGEAFAVAAWVVTSWFSDILPSPPHLVVSGADLSQANKLFSLNRCVCRRGLVLGDFSHQTLASLPMEVRPTLMIAQRDLSDKVLSLLNASNFRSTFMPGRRGAVLDVVCSRALFTGINGKSRSIENAIRVNLLPSRCNLARLHDREQEKIASKFQPQLLRYRLDHLRMVRGQTMPESNVAKAEVKFSPDGFTGSIQLCLPDEPAVTEGVGRLVHQEEEDRARRLACDIAAVIVEVLWTKLQDPRAEIGVGRIAEFANAMLRLRGENRVYSAEETGWQLRDMGIPRHSGRDCNSVRFSREIWKRVHELAQIYGLRLPPHANNCIHCKQLQTIEN